MINLWDYPPIQLPIIHPGGHKVSVIKPFKFATFQLNAGQTIFLAGAELILKRDNLFTHYVPKDCYLTPCIKLAKQMPSMPNTKKVMLHLGGAKAADFPGPSGYN